MMVTAINDSNKSLYSAKVRIFLAVAVLVSGSVLSFFRPVCAPVTVNLETEEQTSLETAELFFLPQKKTVPFRPASDFSVFAEVSGNFRISEVEIRSVDLQKITTITIFIGNHVLYIPQTEIEMSVKIDNGYGLLNDLLNPILLISFCLAFMILYYPELLNYDKKKHSRKTEYVLLCLICVVGFLLRYVNRTRYSACIDELFSVTVANPQVPLAAVFSDPGNPPLYYLLLRMWFTLFGWNEEAGRMFSVLLGTISIITMYLSLKNILGNGKMALLGAVFSGLSLYMIGYATWMRAYILELALVPLAILFYFKLLNCQTKTSLVIYALICSMLVNSHYYGILFVTANFIFFIWHTRKKIKFPEFASFFAANCLVALSFLPFYIFTAFKQAMQNENFNSWIKGFGLKTTILLLVFLVISGIVFFLVTRLILRKGILKEKYTPLLDYCFYVFCLVLGMALLISLKRPIYSTRYMVICYPLFLIILTLFMTIRFDFLKRHGKSINGKIKIFLITLILVFLVYNKIPPGGSHDVYHEAQIYIEADSAKEKNPVLLSKPVFGQNPNAFYGLRDMKTYDETPEGILYINPHHWSVADIQNRILQIQNYHKLTRIRINEDRYVFKIVL